MTTTSTAGSSLDERIPTWVRVVMVAALAVPQLLVGIWALAAPRAWYDNFPGFSPHLISAEPPFNQHLATDVGAGFFATGVALVVAALLARRSGVYVALAAYAAFAIPHVLYHATHEAPGLTDGENVANVVVLSSSLVLLAVVAWGARPRSRARCPTRPEGGVIRGRAPDCETAGVWSTVLGDLLPIAAAVALSPIPIIAVILVLDTPKARTVGPAFAVGWILGLTVVSSLVVLVAGGSSEPDSGADQTVNWAKVAIGVVFLVMAGRQWRKRPRADGATEMPKWMASLDSITPGRGFVLGVALSAANPKNLALALAAGASIAQAGLDGIDTVIALAIFVVVGSITVAGAVVFAVVAPDAAARPLAGMKAFMTRHNALIMTVVLLVLGVKLLLDGLDGALR